MKERFTIVKLIQLTYSQLKSLRHKQWLKQDKKCPILDQKIPFDESVFDHKHKKKAEKIGEDGKGLLRAVLHRQTNAFEGRVLKNYIRNGLHKFISLPELLRNLAAFYETTYMEPKYIHPSEKAKREKLGKRQYKDVCKHYFLLYPNRKKLPKYPKSGFITKEFRIHLIKLYKYKEKNGLL